jgi:hypothetical protein
MKVASMLFLQKDGKEVLFVECLATGGAISKSMQALPAEWM